MSTGALRLAGRIDPPEAPDERSASSGTIARIATTSERPPRARLAPPGTHSSWGIATETP